MKIKTILFLSYVLFASNPMTASSNWCCCWRKKVKKAGTRLSFSSTASDNDAYQFFEENGDQLIITFMANPKYNKNKPNNRQTSTSDITMQVVRNVIGNTEETKQNKTASGKIPT